MKRPMRTLALILTMIGTIALAKLAQASTFYSVNGQLVSQGKAEDMIRKDTKLKVYKLQANLVELNDRTGNFKKSDDIDETELKKLLK